ncbi:hypothetical protein F5Y10DRAFT_261363 [Nemania abortiva]|nr:hypothetical protein F5Y10DRAFT_261363 [Nemania abortiva]
MQEVQDQPSPPTAPWYLGNENQQDSLKGALVKANSPEATMPNERPKREPSPHTDYKARAHFKNDAQIHGDLNGVRQIGRGNRGHIDGSGNGMWQDSSVTSPGLMSAALVVFAAVLLLSRFPHLIGLA